MVEEFLKVKQDIADFNARIKTWKLDALSDEQADEVSTMLDETLDLLAGDDVEFDDEEDDDSDE